LPKYLLHTPHLNLVVSGLSALAAFGLAGLLFSLELNDMLNEDGCRFLGSSLLGELQLLIGVEVRLSMGLPIGNCGLMSGVTTIEVEVEERAWRGTGDLVRPGMENGVPAKPAKETGVLQSPGIGRGELDIPGIDTGVLESFLESGVLVKHPELVPVDDTGMWVDTRLYKPVTGSWTSWATGEVSDPPVGIEIVGVICAPADIVETFVDVGSVDELAAILALRLELKVDCVTGKLLVVLLMICCCVGCIERMDMEGFIV